MAGINSKNVNYIADAIKDAVKCFAIYWGETDASELRGKNLSCWCGETKPCHADILLKLANQKK